MKIKIIYVFNLNIHWQKKIDCEWRLFNDLFIENELINLWLNSYMVRFTANKVVFT